MCASLARGGNCQWLRVWRVLGLRDRVAYFTMTPDLVRPHVCGIEVLFLGVEDHTVDRGVLVKFGILDVLVQSTLRVDGEDV